ncbi:hypothetical protein [Parasitella parasitica]|uniref:Uncharacterized protein n=1 Tax=Parasitella parasitica TaxID=35722 RepID=A0A0B7NKL2_9FUNG|nr:hypothetical protein [Parasitella parasitica]
MGSDNDNMPSTSSSDVNDELSVDAYERPTSASSNNTNMDVHALKERIIATNKLFRYLQDAKNASIAELSTREAQISTLKANLGVSVKNAQEADENYKKLADKAKLLEDQLRSKSFQIDSLKNDLRKQADLAKRMGSNAAEFRTAKDQVAKLKEENKKLTESLSQLQAEKDQLDEEAMETSINHNLTIESLREEITELRSSLTTDDSELVSLRLQLSAEKDKIKSLQQNLEKSNEKSNDAELVSLRLQLSAEKSKASKAASQIKSLEQKLEKSNEKIKELNGQLLQKKPQQIPIPASNHNMDSINRVHAEEVNSLKAQIAQLTAKLERKAASPSTTTQPTPNPTVLKKYHQLKGKYQLLKKTNGFLNQELQTVLSNASENRGVASDSDSEVGSPESLDDDANMPTAMDLDSSTLDSAATTKPATAESSFTLPRPRSSNTRNASVVQNNSPPRDRRLAHHQNQLQAADEFSLQQKSGLIAPPPHGNTTKLPKKRTSLLSKFVNAKNPSKVLERAKTPTTSTTASTTVSTTATNTTTLALSKKRSHSAIQNDHQAIESSANLADKTPAPATAPASVTATTSVAAATAASDTITETPPKKVKPDYHLNHVIEGIFNKSNGQVMPTIAECKEITPKLLDEIQDCYCRIKSVAVLTDTKLVPVGASDLELPKSMDHREKMYAWFMVSLLKVDRQEFNPVVFKLVEIIKNCPVSKGPLNNKLVRLIRLFTIACKAENSPGRLRTLIYALFKTIAFHATLIPSLLNVGVIWKESFTFATTDPHFESLRNTFLSCLHLISCRSNTTKNIKQMHERLTTLFGWSQTPKPVLDCIEDSMNILQSTYFKELHADDKGKFDALSFNLITSFELALTVLDDWKQTYDVFIRQKLWPMLGMEVLDVVAMELLGRLAQLGISEDPLKADKPGVVTLLDTFSTIIDLGKDIDPSEKHLQFAAAKSMIAVAGNHRQYRKFLANMHGI